MRYKNATYEVDYKVVGPFHKYLHSLSQFLCYQVLASNPNKWNTV